MRQDSGLAKIIVSAVKSGQIPPEFRVRDIMNYCDRNGLHYKESYYRVILANGSAETHSLSYKKYFKRLEKGLYELSKKGILEG